MNLDRVQKKGENFSSTVQPKKSKGILPKIAYPAKNNTSDVEFPDEILLLRRPQV